MEFLAASALQHDLKAVLPFSRAVKGWTMGQRET